MKSESELAIEKEASRLESYNLYKPKRGLLFSAKEYWDLIHSNKYYSNFQHFSPIERLGQNRNILVLSKFWDVYFCIDLRACDNIRLELQSDVMSWVAEQISQNERYLTDTVSLTRRTYSIMRSQINISQIVNLPPTINDVIEIARKRYSFLQFSGGWGVASYGKWRFPTGDKFYNHPVSFYTHLQPTNNENFAIDYIRQKDMLVYHIPDPPVPNSVYDIELEVCNQGFIDKPDEYNVEVEVVK